MSIARAEYRRVPQQFEVTGGHAVIAYRARRSVAFPARGQSVLAIRESTVPGLVGAGGIGFALNEAILGLEWSRVGMILLVILTVVIAAEAASACLRARLT